MFKKKKHMCSTLSLMYKEFVMCERPYIIYKCKECGHEIMINVVHPDEEKTVRCMSSGKMYVIKFYEGMRNVNGYLNALCECGEILYQDRNGFAIFGRRWK